MCVLGFDGTGGVLGPHLGRGPPPVRVPAAGLLRLEHGLLAVCGVPHVVCDEHEHVHRGCERPVVAEGAVVQQVQRRRRVRERDACRVPEQQHEAEALVHDVPCARHVLLALVGGVGVEEVGQRYEAQLGGDAAEVTVLADCGGGGDDEEEGPGDADIEEHLEVDAAEAGVEQDAHEGVVDSVAGRGVRVGRGRVPDRPCMQHDGGCEGEEDACARCEGSGGKRGERVAGVSRKGGNGGGVRTCGHEGAKVINDPDEVKHAGDMHERCEHERDVPSRGRVAHVRVLLAVRVFCVHLGVHSWPW